MDVEWLPGDGDRSIEARIGIREREERLVAVGECVVDERERRGVVEFDGRTVRIEIVCPQKVVLCAEDVARQEVREIEPARIAQKPGMRQVDGTALQSLPLRRQSLLAADRQTADACGGRRLGDVDLRNRQRPRAALDVGRPRERRERRRASVDGEPVHRTIERDQDTIEERVECGRYRRIPPKVGRVSVHRPVDVTADPIDRAPSSASGEMEGKLLGQMHLCLARIGAVRTGGICVDQSCGVEIERYGRFRGRRRASASRRRVAAVRSR